MQITIHGAAREVTGSCHLLESDGAGVLLDCGMIQGGKERHERNRARFPFDPTDVEHVVLSHAHIDHSGRLPLLVKRGFRGRILATPPTIHLAEILLTDSGRLHEEDARWKRERLQRRGQDASWVEPLYTERDALAVIDRFEPLYFDVWRAIPDLGRVRLLMAGHILGAAFAVGRTQEVLARINDLVERERIPHIPVFVDSPMAVEATRVFARFPEAWSAEARERDRAGDRPLEFDGLRLITRVEESKELNSLNGPMVIVSASGMLTGGRIKHHLRRSIGDPASTLVFVGYQARGTLGRLIQEGVDPIRIFGEWHRVRMRIEALRGFSAHADRDELLQWFEGIEPVPSRTLLVHGEPEAAEALGAEIERRFGAAVAIPDVGQTFALQ